MDDMEDIQGKAKQAPRERVNTDDARGNTRDKRSKQKSQSVEKMVRTASS